MKSLDGNDKKSQTSSGDNNGFFTPNATIDFSNVKIEPLFEDTVDFDTFSKSDFRAVKVKDSEEELHLLMVDNHIPAGAKIY